MRHRLYRVVDLIVTVYLNQCIVNAAAFELHATRKMSEPHIDSC